MPTYCYRCPDCGEQEEVIKPMKEADKEEFCRLCTCENGSGVPMERDYASERKGVVGTEKGDTFWSQSMAINPSQTTEHRRLFPNVRVREDGVIGFDSVKERDDYCNRTGFYKVPGKSKRNRKMKSPSTPAQRASLEKSNETNRKSEASRNEQTNS